MVVLVIKVVAFSFSTILHSVLISSFSSSFLNEKGG